MRARANSKNSKTGVSPYIAARYAQALRIVAFSDCRVQDIEAIVSWVARLSEEPDLIIYTGDDIRRFVPNSETNYFEQLASLSRYGLVAVMGNDDLPKNRSLIQGHKVFEVHSQPVAIGKFLIVGLEGAPDHTIIGSTLHTEPDIAQHLRKSNTKSMGGRTTIVVSHTPPRGCLDEASRYGNRQIGSTALRETVEQNSRIALVVCGHVHNCGGHADKLEQATVLNTASHDSSASVPAKIATLFLHSDGSIEDLEWGKVLSSRRLSSEINEIGRIRAEQLAQSNITEVEQLAEASPETVARSLGRSPKTAAVFIARARAHLEGHPILVSTPELPERPRLYLDIETDLQHSFTWLVGIADEESDKVSQFFASTPGKEREILLELAAFLSDKEGHRLVHFSGRSFDYRILSQRMEYHGIALPRPLSQSVDCLPTLRRSIALPSPGFSLTEAASDFGYEFSYPEIDGWRIAYEYQQNIQLGKPIPENLLAYNRDDVLALRFLLQEVERFVTQLHSG